MDPEGSNSGSSWENLNNEEGLPAVEQTAVDGLHRAFFHLPGGKREWTLVKKTDTGWVECTKRYAYVGPITRQNGQLRVDVQELGDPRHQPIFLVPEETAS